MPLVMTAPLVFAAVAPFVAFVRTRSAHDFGGAGFGGVFGAACSSAAGACSPLSTSTELCSTTDSAAWPFGVGVEASVTGVCRSCFSAEDGDCRGLGKPGMFGTAIAVLVSFLVCDGVGVTFGDGTAAWAGVAGVETCVKSLSEGACDVAGVSGSDGAAIVDVSDGASSVAACSCSCGSSSVIPSLAGSATASSDLCRFCRLRRRGMARGGKAPSASVHEYHGRGGQKGVLCTG